MKKSAGNSEPFQSERFFKPSVKSFYEISIYFAVLLFGSLNAIWFSGEFQERWLPKDNATLYEAYGELLSPINCSYNEINCKKAYGLKTNSGVILLNCEPSPPINTCLDSFGNDSKQLVGKNISVKFLQLNDGVLGKDFKVVMSAMYDNEQIFTYAERLKDIQNTTTGSSKIGQASRYKRSKLVYVYIALLGIPGFIFLCVLSLFSKNTQSVKGAK